MSETIAKNREDLIDECTITPVGRAALRLAAESGGLESADALRQQLRNQIIEVTDAFDSMDHRITPMGSGVQDDCQALREQVRSLPEM